MVRELDTLLSQSRTVLAERWLESILSAYPLESAKFFKSKKDPFSNPVGQTFARELGVLLDELIQGSDAEKLRPSLDSIIRIRAVQDFSVSQCVGFVFELKTIVRQELAEALRDNRELAEALLAFETRIDALALLAFEVYLACKEKLWEIRATEIKNRTHLLFERVNKIYGNSGDDA